jgi:hypothetical protein
VIVAQVAKPSPSCRRPNYEEASATRSQVSRADDRTRPKFATALQREEFIENCLVRLWRFWVKEFHLIDRDQRCYSFF